MINRIEGFFENDGKSNGEPSSSEFKQTKYCTKEIMKLAKKLAAKGVDPAIICKTFVHASIELAYRNAPSEDIAALTILGGICGKLHDNIFKDDKEKEEEE